MNELAENIVTKIYFQREKTVLIVLKNYTKQYYFVVMILYWGKFFVPVVVVVRCGGFYFMQQTLLICNWTIHSCTQSVKVFESDLLENVQVVATKAGHLSEWILVKSKSWKWKEVLFTLGHLGLARSLRFGKKTSMMLSVRFVEMMIFLLL